MMPLTGISKRGLALVAVLVAILWGCIVAERAIVRQAYVETERFLHSSGPVQPASTKSKAASRQLASPAADFARAAA